MKRIAVMSGKGGVGKSFVAAGLAIGLRRKGLAVGVLDADITGASIPHVLGVGKGPRTNQDGSMAVGRSSTGIAVVSMSLLLPTDDKAVIWRGPLISRAIDQLHDDTNWEDTEVMVIDMPPGTSDAALTVLQSIKPDAVIAVSTPQDLVTTVARKSQDMAAQVEVPLLGFVENMAYLQCPHCDERIYLFGESGEDRLLAGGASLLAQLPLVPEQTALADQGRLEEAPLPEFDALASTVWEAVGILEAANA
ncbi:MAG: P-loop NTPase [Coriobacteriia bacterium]|nr:P-loop NTPase [Coriobacteriia bacterium]